MSVIRVQKRQNPYVSIDKTCLNDPKLSWKGKGLHTYLISLPADWTINVKDLVKRSQEVRDAILGMFKELESAGYLHREIRRNSNGQSMGTVYVIFEIPQTQNAESKNATSLEKKGPKPKSENPLAVNTLTANPQLLKNKYKQGIKKTSSNKDYCKLENQLHAQHASCDLAAASSDFKKNKKDALTLIGEKFLSYRQQAIDLALEELNRSLDTKLRKEIFGVLFNPTCFTKAGNDFYMKRNTIKKHILDGRWAPPASSEKAIDAVIPTQKTKQQALHAEVEEKIREIHSLEQALSSPAVLNHEPYRKSMEEGIKHAHLQLHKLQQSLDQVLTTEGELL